MENHLEKRPILPATSRTTSAGGSNKNKKHVSVVRDSNKYSPESIIQRLIQPLSVDSQNSVLSMVQCLVENQRLAISRNEHMKTEMVILRNDCDKAKADTAVSLRQIENLKVKVDEANKKNDALVDLVHSRDEQHTQTQLLFERLRRDNTLLKESVESINLSAPRANSATPKSRPSSSISPVSRSRDHLQQALRDADLSLSIMEDTEMSESESQFVTSTMASVEASVGIVTNEPKSQRRPVTAPVSLPSIVSNNNDNNEDSSTMKSPDKVRFDSSIDKPRPQTAGPTMKASIMSPSVRTATSPTRSIASISSEKSEKSDVSANTNMSILDKPPERINGTFRNQPESFLLDKLRKALLRMTRDKYRAEKREKILVIHMENIKAELKEATSKMRHMQIELAEFRGNGDGIEFASTFHGKQPVLHKEKAYGPMDELFRTMIERRAFNPVDMILQFRRIIDHLSHMPGTLDKALIARHVGSKVMMEILEVDMIVIFAIEPNDDKIAHKYTVRSVKPEVIELQRTTSMFSEVLTKKRTIKANQKLKKTSFNTEVDGCAGVLARNVLTVPLLDEKNSHVIGAIQLINKAEGSAAFTELDELFMSVYANMCVSAFLACDQQFHVSYRADILTNILDAQTPLLKLMPAPRSVFIKDIEPQAVLKALEEGCKHCLHCQRVKAFLVVDDVLMSLDTKISSAPSASRRDIPLIKTGISLGSAGHVARTQEWHVVAAGEVDNKAHPDVDVETNNAYFIVPILSIKGQTMAILQLIVGSRSPKVSKLEGKADNLTFEQATEMLVRVLRAPLQLIIATIGEDLNKSFNDLRRLVRKSSKSPSSTPSPPKSRKSGQDSFSNLPLSSEHATEIEDVDDLGLDGEDHNAVFEMCMQEVKEAQERLQEVVEENEQLKRTVTQLQALYLNETREKTLEISQGVTYHRNKNDERSTRRSLG